MKQSSSSVQQTQPLLATPANQSAPPASQSMPHMHHYLTTPDSNDKLSVPLPTVISRHDSFDQRVSVRSGGSNSKRRKRHRSSQIPIAGNVGSGIGSPRDIAETIDDTMRSGGGRLRNSRSNEFINDGTGGAQSRSRRESRSRTPQHVHYQQTPMPHYHQHHHIYNGGQAYSSQSRVNEVNIPIERLDHRVEYGSKKQVMQTINVNEYADPKVAYRLALNEAL